MNIVMIIIIAYFLVVNLISFALMGIDKKKAVKRAFRIPEATLFTFAIIGGSLGSIIGMFFFHHKTRHWYFRYGMPAILILQIVGLVLILTGPFDIVFL